MVVGTKEGMKVFFKFYLSLCPSFNIKLLFIRHKSDEAVEVPKSLLSGVIFLTDEIKLSMGDHRPPVLKAHWVGPQKEWMHLPVKYFFLLQNIYNNNNNNNIYNNKNSNIYTYIYR